MPQGPLLDAYCDESYDHNGPRYMVYGAVILNPRDDRFNAAFRDWRARHHVAGEAKWTKITRSRLPAYLDLVDQFVEMTAHDVVHFKAAVFDKADPHFKVHRGHDPLHGRYAFFYQFLLHTFCPHATSDQHRLRVFFDDTTYRYPLDRFRRALNAGARRHHGRAVDIIRAVEPVDSRKSDPVQLADVLMGAIGYQWNDAHLAPNAALPKSSVAHHLAKCLQLPSLKTPTSPMQPRFAVWPYPFAPKKGRPNT